MRYFPVPTPEPTPTPSPTTVDISVTVTDGENAVQGASVSVGGKTGTTGSQGGCTVTGVEIGEDVAVAVTCDGYENYSDTITVTSETSTLAITLTAVTPTTYDITITVDDGTDAIEGATVTIGETTGTTDSAGSCALTGVEEGTQTVTVTATGYTTKTESITVDETHTSFTISLTEE